VTTGGRIEKLREDAATDTRRGVRTRSVADIEICAGSRACRWDAHPAMETVDVRGWMAFPTPAEQDQWIRDHADHAMLHLEVEDV
jgi:hypothetical protein